MGPARPDVPPELHHLRDLFLAREVELSCVRASLVTLKDGARPSVTVYLPASKNDLTAQGVARTHFCICQLGPRKDCPVCTAHTHLGMFRRLFPWAVEGNSFQRYFPLFPDVLGRLCKKEAMAATFIHAAGLLGVPAVSPDGSEAITGHSLRVTGAQGLARVGP